MSSASHATPTHTHNQRLLRWVRRLWLLLAGFLFLIFLLAIPATYEMLQTPCLLESRDCGSWAYPTPESIAILEQSSVSLQAAALYLIGLFTAVSVVFWIVGLLIYHYRRDRWFILLAAHLMILNGMGGTSLVFISGLTFTDLPDWMGITVGLLTVPMYQFLSLFFLLFPNGRFYGRWSFIPFILICLNTFFWIVPNPVLNIQNWSPTASGMWLTIVFGSHFLVQIIRYRKMYTHSERQQTKWIIFGFSVPVVILFISGVLIGDTPAHQVHPILNGTLASMVYLPIGLSIGIGILRYRLWDIDVIINRTLSFGALTGILIAVYALVVTTLSQLVQDDGNFVVSLLGAGVIAVLFQPLRQRLQNIINRLMFGRRDEPLAVMTELGASLEKMLSPDAALLHLVEMTAATLRLPYVGIERADTTERVAVGNLRDEPVRFPLVYQGQIIGGLIASSRSPGETLNAADRLVLEGVARQASAVVHAARLTHDLQVSRQEILTTREEERRRLRRDLHDGLGPALATLTLQAEAAREWLSTNPDKSNALLGEIIAGSQSTLAEIRRIVYALRPPALDDLGLLSAIQEQARKLSNNDLKIVIETPENLPVLPAAVEVATYRIIQEGLTNVTRHARARTCKVSLAINGHMDIAIEDDGVGIPTPYRAGVGLKSIYERVDELGGSCQIESHPGMGTRIRVSLPRR